MIETTVCPGRLLEEDGGEAMAVVEWWLESTRFDGMSGQPSGPPEWPAAGGLMRQPAQLVAAVRQLRSAWSRLGERPQSGRQAKGTEEERK